MISEVINAQYITLVPGFFIPEYALFLGIIPDTHTQIPEKSSIRQWVSSMIFGNFKYSGMGIGFHMGIILDTH